MKAIIKLTYAEMVEAILEYFDNKGCSIEIPPDAQVDVDIDGFYDSTKGRLHIDGATLRYEEHLTERSLDIKTEG